MPLPENRHDMPLQPELEKLGLSFSYLHSDANLPLGELGNPETPVENGIKALEDTLGVEFGQIYSLKLTSHPCHNIVVSIGDCEKNGTFTGDAIIVPRMKRSFAVATFVADCSVIVVADGCRIGFIHCGRPELVDGILYNFFRVWGTIGILNAYAFIGPVISGRHYELESIPRGFEEFACQTCWGSQGFDLRPAIERQLNVEGITKRVTTSLADPFELRAMGSDWASARWFKRQSKETGVEQRSPRDCALLTYTPPT